MPAQQHDLLLTQNVGELEIEFTERYVSIQRGRLITGDGNNAPIVLNPGTNGQILSADSGETSGLKWISLGEGHTQNTDTGTTSETFQLHIGSNGARLKSEGIAAMSVVNHQDNGFADFTAKDIIASSIALTTGTISSAPDQSTDIANKAYVDSMAGANDAMVFKGAIGDVGDGGTITISSFNGLSNYNVGWSYKVVTPGTIRGRSALVGDMFIARVNRTGSGAQDNDWAHIPSNMDGAVIGPASSVDNRIATFSGETGKAIQDSGYTIETSVPSNAVFTDTVYNGSTSIVLNSEVFERAALTGDVTADQNSNATTIAAQAVTLAKMANVATGTVFYRKTGGAGAPEVQTLATLKTDLGAMPIHWSVVPSGPNDTGTTGQVARDSNFFYVCVDTNTWRRNVLATWTA